MRTVVPILAPHVRRQLDAIIDTYEQDNCSVWDCDADGAYVLRAPAEGEPRRAAQEIFARGEEPSLKIQTGGRG